MAALLEVLIAPVTEGKTVDCLFLCGRYLQRVVDHPSLLQDPDVREFLEREDVS